MTGLPLPTSANRAAPAFLRSIPGPHSWRPNPSSLGHSLFDMGNNCAVLQLLNHPEQLANRPVPRTDSCQKSAKCPGGSRPIRAGTEICHNRHGKPPPILPRPRGSSDHAVVQCAGGYCTLASSVSKAVAARSQLLVIGFLLYFVHDVVSEIAQRPD